MNNPSPAASQRQKLRDALREELRVMRGMVNPTPVITTRLHRADAIMAGRLISNLPMADLLNALSALGLNAAAIISAPASAATAPATSTGDSTDMDTETDDGLLPPPAAGEAGAADPEAEETAAIERELSELRATVASGGFTALDARLRDLVVASRKPPQVIHVPVEAPPGTGPGAGPGVTQSRATNRSVTWAEGFGVQGPLGANTATLWDGAHPDTPCPRPGYVWPVETVIALTQIKRGKNVFLFGPAGAGKTEWTRQLAATLRRPYVLISCDASTDAATIVGMTVPENGHVTFQPGQLTRAIQTPGAVICIDEPSIARPGALFAFQNVLTPDRTLYVQETGQRIKAAPGVIFVGCDNTNGTGGGSRRGFHGTTAINAATMSRFSVRIALGWQDEKTEAGLVARETGCTMELAALLVRAATTTRQAAAGQGLTQGIGLRALFAWAELLTDGIGVEDAFKCAVESTVPEEEREALRQQCILAVSTATVERALRPARPTAPAAPASLSRAAADFTDVSYVRN